MEWITSLVGALPPPASFVYDTGGQRNREEALDINNKEQNETKKKTGLATFRSTFTLYVPTVQPLQSLPLVWVVLSEW